VYTINDDVALVQTLDFFPPIVDDPYTFGQIAAANSLSDIYAMGGTPITAMNIVCFPQNKLDTEHLRALLMGGMDKLQESGTALVGGHSVDDPELKYGLSVTGIVHPDKVLQNNTPRVGDRLIITKKVGTGIINTAQKGGVFDVKTLQIASKTMATLNKYASEIASTFQVHACTDITGFGLLGHACEMIDQSGVGLRIYFSEIPLLPHVMEYASMVLVPGGTYRNKQHRQHQISNRASLMDEHLDVLFDPQTSGGLLLSVAAQDATALLTELLINNIDAAIIGEVTDAAGTITVEV
jgi:selenide,water dikinase